MKIETESAALLAEAVAFFRPDNRAIFQHMLEDGFQEFVLGLIGAKPDVALDRRNLNRLVHIVKQKPRRYQSIQRAGGFGHRGGCHRLRAPRSQREEARLGGAEASPLECERRAGDGDGHGTPPRHPRQPHQPEEHVEAHVRRLGEVARDKDNASLCTFASGKRYNCDLSASYNIGARYFIRELLKPLPETARRLLEAKVPSTAKRTTCTLSTLIDLGAALSA